MNRLRERLAAPARSRPPQGPFTVGPAHRLAQRLGNQALHQLLRRHLVQAKLTVSDPSDAHEREADQVADAVMRMAEPVRPQSEHGAAPRIQRLCPECEELQREAAGESSALNQGAAEIEPYVDSLPGRGEPLAPSARGFFEPRFGIDFSAVRIHTGPEADRSAQAIDAVAYATGPHIVFRAGHYEPGSERGRKLLAHELVHVVQQRGARDCPDVMADASARVLDRVDSVLAREEEQASGRIPEVTPATGYEPLLQRFISTEPAGGCGLCYGTPANAGKSAHALIQQEFNVLYPVGLVELGVSSPDDDNGRLDLAIAVPGGFEIGEIKPANAEGYENGILQIGKYIGMIQERYPGSAIKPLTKLLPPTIFPTLSPDCPVQVLFVNPPVGGVYGYHCRPSFAELMSRGCKCPPPRLTQKEQEKTAGERNKKQETPSDKQTVPAERPSVVRLIVQFVTIMVEQKAKDYDREARQFINQHPEIAKFIIAAGFGAVVALLADDLSIAGIADDVVIPPLLLALWRAAQAL